MDGESEIGRDWDLLVWWLQEGTANPRGLVLMEVRPTASIFPHGFEHQLP